MSGTNQRFNTWVSSVPMYYVLKQLKFTCRIHDKGTRWCNYHKRRLTVTGWSTLESLEMLNSDICWRLWLDKVSHLRGATWIWRSKCWIWVRRKRHASNLVVRLWITYRKIDLKVRARHESVLSVELSRERPSAAGPCRPAETSCSSKHVEEDAS